jgi:hypothetical protein
VFPVAVQVDAITTKLCARVDRGAAPDITLILPVGVPLIGTTS